MAAGNRRSPRAYLAALIAADSLSRLGSSLTFTAIPWFVLVTTGSVARTGLVVFAQAMGVVLALLLGGAVVDRMSSRHASVTADLAAGLGMMLIPLAYHTVGLAFWQLAVLVFGVALLDTPAQVARYSALPDLAAEAGVRFARANAVFDACITAAALAGPALGGLLIAAVGAANVLWVDALSFVVSAALLAAVPATALPSATPAAGESYPQRVVGALRFLWRDPVLLPLVLYLGAMNIAVGPLDTPIIPVYAREVFRSPIALGLMSSAGAAGALGGNALFGWLGHRLTRRTAFAAAFISVPLAFSLLALRPSLPGVLLVLAVAGFGLSVANLLEYTIYFERMPSDMRGRLLGITGAIGWGTVPVGRLAAGLAMAAVGLRPTLAALAVVFVPVALIVLVVPAFRHLSPPHGEPSLGGRQ